MYSTTVGLGTEQLFWKLGITFAILSPSNTIKVVVKDKDMFYDDYIGTATLQLSEVLDKYLKVREYLEKNG